MEKKRKSILVNVGQKKWTALMKARWYDIRNMCRKPRVLSYGWGKAMAKEKAGKVNMEPKERALDKKMDFTLKATGRHWLFFWIKGYKNKLIFRKMSLVMMWKLNYWGVGTKRSGIKLLQKGVFEIIKSINYKSSSPIHPGNDVSHSLK